MMKDRLFIGFVKMLKLVMAIFEEKLKGFFHQEKNIYLLDVY